MPFWKVLLVARRGWKMIPREQRRKMRRSFAKTARKHGPTVARRVGGVIRQARKRP
jgi:hypothetical protein